MNCFCENGEVKQLKVEGDFSADPIWCDECCANLELDDFDLSPELRKKLKQWALAFGGWIDVEKDVLRAGGAEMEARHNEEGLVLAEELEVELAGVYGVVFSPSGLVGLYKS